MFSTPEEQAKSLVKRIAAQCSLGEGFGSMSVSIYDTAWLSMIESPDKSKGSWLFPECFEFVLNHQLEDGSWEAYASELDSILNTAAALLSLRKHLSKCPDPQGQSDWIQRSNRAQAALERLLNGWDPSSSDQVGFELLVVKHLSLLQEEGIRLEFSQYDSLLYAYNAKLKKIPPETVYKGRSTLYHSLEALIGHIDFDQVGRWQEENGSMSGSPASTAAYLIHASTWDDKAENYLRKVLELGAGKKDGSVPCAWPTSVFETSWVVTTLAAAGLPIDTKDANAISTFLEESLQKSNGVVGFSPTSFADADDTAKAISALRYLNKDFYIGPLIKAFEAEKHFRTYPGERNPSFSANCNVLICLLHQEDLSPHIDQIVKAAKFLCSKVYNGDVYDKWHINDLYWMMLLSQSLSLLYDRLVDGSLQFQDFASLFEQQIPLISIQVLMKTFGLQQTDGSWGGICELTGYGLITVSTLSRLPWCQSMLSDEINSRVHLGKSFLHLHRGGWAKGRHLWIEKVTYASNVLAETYCLAGALSAPAAAAVTTPDFLAENGVYSSPAPEMEQIMHLFKRTPLFNGMSSQVLRAAALQASYALKTLQRRRLEIFPRTGMKKDKYLTIIPFTWMACNALQNGSVDHYTLEEMTFLSMINYQVDEFMEDVVERKFKGRLEVVKTVIQEICSELGGLCSDNPSNGDQPATSSKNVYLNGLTSTLDEVRDILGKYVAYILQHPRVLARPARERETLAAELQVFLLAHVTQAEDNHRFATQQASSNGLGASVNGATQTATSNGHARSSPLEYAKPGRTFYKWVKTTSADHTSCPFSWLFYNCLIAEPYGSLFSTTTSSYAAEDLGRHLASMCRMYNDWGSIARDSDEGNLNSVNFPEFQLGVKNGSAGGTTAKDKLMYLAEYERRGVKHAVEELEGQFGQGRLMSAVNLFINVTDLYGQIYVLKDVGTRKK